MEGAHTSILREAWRIARPYWFSEERWVARGLLTAVIAMNFAGVWITVRINTWQKAFYNTLQNYNEAGFFHQIGLFVLLAGAYIVLLVIRELPSAVAADPLAALDDRCLPEGMAF